MQETASLSRHSRVFAGFTSKFASFSNTLHESWPLSFLPFHSLFSCLGFYVVIHQVFYSWIARTPWVMSQEGLLNELPYSDETFGLGTPLSTSAPPRRRKANFTLPPSPLNILSHSQKIEISLFSDFRIWKWDPHFFTISLKTMMKYLT